MKSIDVVRKKLGNLKEEATKALRNLSRQDEIEKIEQELEHLESEELKAQEAIMKNSRDDALALATEADDEERGALDRLAAIRKKKASALATFEENIPRRRIQTSSSEFIRLQREVEFMQEMGFAPEGSKLLGEKFATRLFEKRKKTEQALIDCIPSKLERFKAKGWFISPGQDPIKAELLTSENSMEVGMAIPEVFYPREE